jgi:hypothetical protein
MYHLGNTAKWNFDPKNLTETKTTYKLEILTIFPR